MSVSEAGFADTPFRRYITSPRWFVLNLGDALAVRNEEKGGVADPIASQEHQFENFGVHLRVLWPGDPNAGEATVAQRHDPYRPNSTASSSPRETKAVPTSTISRPHAAQRRGQLGRH